MDIEDINKKAFDVYKKYHTDPKSEEIALKKSEENNKKVKTLIFVIVTIVVVAHVGIALFGSWFYADKTVLNNTAKAQAEMSNALFLTFNDFGRLEVRADYSVQAYLSKKNYMLVPYPDRDAAISAVGQAWCGNSKINQWYMPKVVLRDIQSGEDFATYRCLFKIISKK